MKKKKTLDKYIEISKADIYVFLFMTVVIFLILLYFSYKINWYCFLLFDIVMVFATIGKINVYFNLKKIKKYLIDSKLIDKIGTIDYWNAKNYFLTDNYMIILSNGAISVFSYSEISEIFIETYLELGRMICLQKYLHIVLNTNDEYKILIFSTSLVGEDFKDISQYLLNKNSNIKIGENKKNYRK